MSKELRLLTYKTRLYLLENKEDPRNARIISKLKRRIANLEDERQDA